MFFIKNKYMALLPSLLWGISSAAINIVVFVRFYSMLNLLCLLLTYLLFVAIKNRFSNWWHIVAILVVSFLGTLTHQFFFVFAFFICSLGSVYLLSKKELKALLMFSSSMVVAFLGYQMVNRQPLTILFTGGSRSQETVENFVHGNTGFIGRIEQYADLISRAVFGSISPLIVLALFIILMLFIGAAYTRNGEKITELMKNQNVALWLIMGGTCALYLIMIARIAPSQTFRYISCITPYVVIVIISLLVTTLEAIGFRTTVIIFVLVTIPYSMLLTINIYDVFLYRDGYRTDDELSSYYHLPLLCVSRGVGDVVPSYWRFFKFEDQIMFTLAENMDIDIIRENEFENGMVLVLSDSVDSPAVTDLLDATGLRDYMLVCYLPRYIVYLIE